MKREGYPSRMAMAAHSTLAIDVLSADWLGICRRVVTAQRRPNPS